MDQKPEILIQCPEHRSQNIGLFDTDPSAKKLGYCFGCISKANAEGTLPKGLKTFPEYLDETSDFYKKCRQRIQNAGEPPAEYIDELSKKLERLEMLNHHIDKETQKVKDRFKDIRKVVLESIDSKEKECLRLLEEGTSGFSDIYEQYEKLLKTGWTRFSDDLEAIFPTGDVFEQRISRISNLEHLQGFMREVNEDMNLENLYSSGKAGLRKLEINNIISLFHKIETSLPRLQGKLLDSEDIEGLVKELLKEFDQQSIKVENSIAQRKKELLCGSKIINGEQFKVLESWLPNYNNLNLKLLYRASEDGMSGPMFHSKCDNKGATITLIKCKFDGAVSSSVIGGFIDQSWNSILSYTASQTAFLFSLTAGTPAVKCSIQHSQYGLYGRNDYGPTFGGGHDLHIPNDFKQGTLHNHSYSNTIAALSQNNQRNFTVEDVEVFQVL